MEEKAIKWRKKSSSTISQIYDSGLEYCWISKGYEQCSRLVFCKDFLQDCIWAVLYNRPATIYQFEYDPSKKPLVDLECTRIAITSAKDKKFGSKVLPMLEFVNYFSRLLGLRRSRLSRCSNPPKRYIASGLYIIEGTPMWMNAPPLLSLFTLLIRVGLVHSNKRSPMETIKGVWREKIKPYGEEDSEYLAEARSGINRLLTAGYRKYFYTDIKRNYPEGATIGRMHNDCGIVGWSTQSSKSVVPGWHYKKKWDVKIEEII